MGGEFEQPHQRVDGHDDMQRQPQRLEVGLVELVEEEREGGRAAEGVDEARHAGAGAQDRDDDEQARKREQPDRRRAPP